MLTSTTLALFAAFALQETDIDPNQSDLRVSDLRSHIEFFCSEELEGRERGHDGGIRAGQYVEAHFKQLGLKPIGEDDLYRLPFTAQDLTCYNVVGVLPGTNPELADEYLMIGGHHDHAGIGGPGAMGFAGEIHNGADDNASGASGVLELAEYFVAHPTTRPIIFATFSAEEAGLLGSKALANGKELPIANIRAMINLDMIGRSVKRYLFVGGMGTAREFHKRLDPLLEASPFKIEVSDQGEAPSDNTSFYEVGIPSLFFFTNVHDDYHLPTDDADKIEYEAEIGILELVRDIAIEINDGEGAFSFKKAPGMGMPKDFWKRNMDHMRLVQKRTQNRGKFGMGVEVMEDGRISVNKVSSAAKTARVKVGDVLLTVNERAIASIDDLRRAMAGGMKGDAITLTVSRKGKTKSLKGKLK
ncbi:MAG: M28 family peptidase [Planctomycetes bacterium]|jgi:hypothetical protein|nr:M28 family peptidase [Planctomycetota bacterium]MBT4028114.1 M28 family peptidase [Planctomycetota bacterium]MBT4561009.1 M28 family peptidase [Planctomycetota bacterium]MBT7012620.1 M28 family peptidase [Planctomycetota bacterium]MBT7317840.1 M28 family peptidase [Planctomycetota bacterium]